MHLHTALQLSFSELEILFSSRVSKLALNLMERFPHPDYLAGLSQTQVKNILKKTQTNDSPRKKRSYSFH